MCGVGPCLRSRVVLSASWQLEEAADFGISVEDEGPHPFSEDHPWWNESVFYDWYDAEGRNAGHCRIGWHPNQGRLWFWLFLYNGDEWVGIEEPRLPLSSLALPSIAYDDGWGLSFSYQPREPLCSGRLAAAGFGRVLSGRRAGLVLPVAVELEVVTVGPPHSLGESSVPGHSDESYSTNRFEQPIRARGAQTIAGDRRELELRGERDHSWGPRSWNLEWTFMVLNTDALRMQAGSIRIPELPEIQMGYLHRERTISLSEVAFELDFDDDSPTRPFAGRFSVVAEDGSGLAGTVEPISGVEVDITHTFEPPRRSVYRRALIRCRPEGDGHGGDGALLGWIESNRFVRDNG